MTGLVDIDDVAVLVGVDGVVEEEVDMLNNPSGFEGAEKHI